MQEKGFMMNHRMTGVAVESGPVNANMIKLPSAVKSICALHVVKSLA
jgi:hypothetical protein